MTFRALLLSACILGILGPGVCLGQLPVGTITGVVRDSTGGVIAGAQVTAVSRTTRQARTTATGERGEYSFPALLPGEYDVNVEAAGFQRVVQAAIVEAGTTTSAEIVLGIGDLADVVTVEAAAPQIHYESGSVSGL